MKKIVLPGIFYFLFLSGSAQNTGINNTAPAYPLDVTGTIRTSTVLRSDSGLIVNAPSTLRMPQKGITLYDGKIRFVNPEIPGTFDMAYDLTNTRFLMGTPGIPSLSLTPNGYLGVGTFYPEERLHVMGKQIIEGYDATLSLRALGENNAFVQLSDHNLRLGTYSNNTTGKVIIRNGGTDNVTVLPNGNVDMAGSVAIDGNLTVGAKGIIKSNTAASLRYHTQPATVNITLPAFGTSGEIDIAWPPATFATAPKVIVGNIVSTGGNSGELYRLQLVIYGATATGCKARVISTSNSSLQNNVTWNIICIGN